jgi:hypothetical protein
MGLGRARHGMGRNGDGSCGEAECVRADVALVAAGGLRGVVAVVDRRFHGSSESGEMLQYLGKLSGPVPGPLSGASVRWTP